MQRIAVVGGGINGAGIAWELVRRGYGVTLFDKGRFGGATSSATSKLIHGGLRYLEHLQFGIVRESLRERAFLLQHVPDLVHALEFVLPVYRGDARSPLMIRLGLILYDFLAGSDPLPRHRRITINEVLEVAPVRSQGLRGGFRYFDAQVDDAGLVRRVVEAARRSGLNAREQTPVKSLISQNGGWLINDERFDAVVIAAGPWMNEFVEVPRLTLVRGSHIYLGRKVSSVALLLQSPIDQRVFFILPWKDQTMVGTTEVRHDGSPDEVTASAEEIDYLIESFNAFFPDRISRGEVVRTTSGVRPLIGDDDNLGAVSRDYRVEADGTLIKVFGGKMTTFMSLSRKVADHVDRAFGARHVATPPVF